ncbi:MAG: hypothetical protein OJF50_002489 [Nitrospira sp.]|jgi:hypothetical protein|nr:hypothetical protein [Nitrospira sp.]
MRRQADRFERLADKSWHNWEAAVTPPRIAQLLRREHRAVLRLIQRAQSYYIDSEYRHVCQEILDVLKRRAR